MKERETMKKAKRLFAVLIAICMMTSIITLVAACDDPDNGHTGTWLPIADYRAYTKADLKSVKDGIGSVSEAIDGKITEAYNAG